MLTKLEQIEENLEDEIRRIQLGIIRRGDFMEALNALIDFKIAVAIEKERNPK